MAKREFEVIDADGHLSDTDEGIAPYLDERYRKRRRPFYPRDNFDRQMGGILGHRAKDVASWLGAMDIEGIDVAVLYPTRRSTEQSLLRSTSALILGG